MGNYKEKAKRLLAEYEQRDARFKGRTEKHSKMKELKEYVLIYKTPGSFPLSASNWPANQALTSWAEDERILFHGSQGYQGNMGGGGTLLHPDFGGS